MQVKSGSLAGQRLTSDLTCLRSQIRCCHQGMYSEVDDNIVFVSAFKEVKRRLFSPCSEPMILKSALAPVAAGHAYL